jgi:hypothetical protein
VNGTALTIEYTVSVNGFHLHHLAADPEIPVLQFGPGKAQVSTQALKVPIVKGDRGFSVTAVAALAAAKDITLFAHLRCPYFLS